MQKRYWSVPQEPIHLILKLLCILTFSRGLYILDEFFSPRKMITGMGFGVDNGPTLTDKQERSRKLAYFACSLVIVVVM